ncbi:MAG: NAD-dependent epimerase/dehydratase family protein [Tagaea sp.]|nr:NAD-dependent epimerase/dehydratase family protein [Tagaea sp.]
MGDLRRILVTGSTGVLGAAVKALAPSLPAREFRFVSRKDADLRDPAATLALVRDARPDAILHLAAISGGIELARRYPARILRDNVAMTFSVLDAAVSAKVPKTVMTLSSGMYPAAAPQPNAEAQIHDGRPHDSAYSYAMAKRLIEPAIRAYRQEHGIDAIGLVPSGIFGEDDNYNPDDCTWIAGLVRRFGEWVPASGDIAIWGDGAPVREITDARDMARAYLWALDAYSEAEPLNVGCGQGHTIREVAFLLAELAGVPAERVKFDPARARGIDRRVTDNSRLRALSGMEFTPLRASLARVLDWYRSARAQAPNSIRRNSRFAPE